MAFVVTLILVLGIVTGGVIAAIALARARPGVETAAGFSTCPAEANEAPRRGTGADASPGWMTSQAH